MSYHYDVYFALMVFAFATYTQETDPQFAAQIAVIRKDCGIEEGVDVETAQKLWDENKFPNDNKLKCYHKCMNLKLGVIDASGEVVDDKLREVSGYFNDANTQREIVEECGHINGADLCDTAYRMMACMKAAILDD